MSANLQELRVIIDAGHPVTGAYNVDDSIANDELHALNLDGPPDDTAFREYIAYERFRTGTLFGRLSMVANTQIVWDGTNFVIPDQPLGAADALLSVTSKQIASAASLILFTAGGADLSLSDSRLDTILDDVALSTGCEAIGATDKTNLQGLSVNRWSILLQESTENGKNVGGTNTSDVIRARALP